MNSPELSIVAVTRNDNHGGDMTYRMQLFIEGIFFQSEKYKYPVELIIVEWNPPKDRPPLAESLSWPQNHKYCFVRIIKVPEKLHQNYKHAKNLPLYQMIGKNVGIRRAKGDFILATNVDVLFSDELFKVFASGKLKKGKMYRVDRYDVKNDIPVYSSHDERLKYCESNVLRINQQYGTKDINNNKKYPIYPENVHELNKKDYFSVPLHTNACGDFQLMAWEHWNELHGYPELDLFSMYIDGIFEHMAYHHGIEEEVLHEPIFHIDHIAGWSLEGQNELLKRLTAKDIQSLEYGQYLDLTLKMHIERKPLIFNDQNWGFRKNMLQEYVINEKGIKQSHFDSEKFEFYESCNTGEWLKRINQIHKEIEKETQKNNLKEGDKNKQKEMGLKWFEENVNNKKVVVFGAGSGYDLFTKLILDAYNIRPEYFVDNDHEKVGEMKNNIEIYSVEKLLDENKEEILILVSSQFYQEIKDQLVKLGYKEHQNFFPAYQY
ncbi:hypothetical protein ACFFIX_10770 [Metabacillus herbersteinensis]|uniref:Glycosyltransferase n=1 Tax=Metabacillus herbersteinensis TaxID=283816 RepID=A0ABV6GEP4_9BACI